MKKILFIVLIFVCGLSIGQTNNQFVKDAKSSYQEIFHPDGISDMIISNSKFDYIPNYNNKPDGKLLILQKCIKTLSADDEFFKFKTVVTAWYSKKNKYDSILWTIKDSSDFGEDIEGYFRTEVYACCESENVYHYYDINNGKLIISSTNELINVNPTSNLYFLSSSAMTGELRNITNENNVIGCLTLICSNKILDRLIISTATEEEAEDLSYTPEITLSNNKSSNNTIDNLLVSLKYSNDKMFSILVKNNLFDIKSISLPKDFKVFRAK